MAIVLQKDRQENDKFVNYFLFLKTKLLSGINKGAKFFNVRWAYRSKYGLKMINPSFRVVDDTGCYTLSLNPKNLLLGIDFLDDSNTLLGTELVKSPHYGLVHSISNGDGYKNTEYVSRMLEGRLDGRPEIISYYLNSLYFPRTLAKDIDEIKNNRYKSVVVYYVDDKLYIHDGKHHAATAAFLGCEITCKVVDSREVYHTLNSELVNKCKKDKAFSKHSAFIEKMDGEPI